MHRLAARYLIRVAATVLAAAGLYRFAWLPWTANVVLSAVEARSRLALKGDDPAAVAIIARNNIDALRRIAPAVSDDANYYMLYAANARFLNDLDVAAAEYTAALDHADRRPEIYYERGLVYLAMGRTDAAVADLAHAAQFDPNLVLSLSGELQDRVVLAAGLKKR